MCCAIGKYLFMTQKRAIQHLYPVMCYKSKSQHTDLYTAIYRSVAKVD